MGPGGGADPFFLVVLCVGALHGGLNLYNNGFSAGLVCIILIPLIEVFQKEKGI